MLILVSAAKNRRKPIKHMFQMRKFLTCIFKYDLLSNMRQSVDGIRLVTTVNEDNVETCRGWVKTCYHILPSLKDM